MKIERRSGPLPQSTGLGRGLRSYDRGALLVLKLRAAECQLPHKIQRLSLGAHFFFLEEEYT
jgi:hypothetical protein